MRAFITKNGNLLFNVEGVCFFTQNNRDFTFLNFTNESEWRWVKNQNPKSLKIKTKWDKEKIEEIFSSRPENIFSRTDKQIVLERAGIMKPCTREFPKANIEILDWTFDPYLGVENGKSVSINETKFIYKPVYVNYKSRQWLVFGINYLSREGQDKIYIAPSFGKEVDKKYLAIMDYIHILNIARQKKTFDIKFIKSILSQMQSILN